MRACAALVVLAGCFPAALVGREVDPSPLRFSQDVRAVAFAPDGRLAATDGLTVRVFDEQGELVERHAVAAEAIAFMGSSELVAIDAERVFFLSKGTTRKKPVASPTRAFAASKDGQLAWSDGFSVWLLEGELPRHLDRGHADEIVQLAFSPSGELLAAAHGLSNPLELWRRGAPSEVAERMGDEPVRSTSASREGLVAFSEDGRRLVASNPLRIVELPEQDGLRDLDGPCARSTLVLESREPLAARLSGHELVVATCGRTVRSFGSSPRTIVWRSARCAAISPDGERLALGAGASVEVFSTATGKLLFSGHGRHPSSLAASEALRATVVDDGVVVRDEDGTRFLSFLEPRCARISPDGRTLAVSTNEELVLLDAKGRTLLEVPGVEAWFSPDGRQLAWVNGCTRILDVATLRPTGETRTVHPQLAFVPTLENGVRIDLSRFEGARVMDVAVTDEAILLALGARQKSFWQEGIVVRIDRAMGETSTFEAPFAWSAAVSRDGRRAAFACGEGVSVFDALSGNEVARWKPPGSVAAVAFSPSGELLAALSTGAVYAISRSDGTAP